MFNVRSFTSLFTFTFIVFVGLQMSAMAEYEDEIAAYRELVKPVFDEQSERSSIPQERAFIEIQTDIVFAPYWYAECYNTLPMYAEYIFNTVICNSKVGSMIVPVPENPYDLGRPVEFAHDFTSPKPGQMVSGYYKHPNGAFMFWVVVLSDKLDRTELDGLEKLRLQEGGLALAACPEPGSGKYPGGDPGTLPGGNPDSIKYFFVHYLIDGDRRPNQIH